MSLATELQREDRERRAMLTSLGRAWLIAAPLLIARQVIARDDQPRSMLVPLMLDAIGLLLGWWAMRPALREGGQRFLRTAHWSGAAAIPFLWAVYILAADLYFLLRAYL